MTCQSDSFFQKTLKSMPANCSCIFIFRNHFTQLCLAALKTGRNNSRMLAAIFLLELQSLTALHYSQVHILIYCENEAACMFLTQQLLSKRKKKIHSGDLVLIFHKNDLDLKTFPFFLNRLKTRSILTKQIKNRTIYLKMKLFFNLFQPIVCSKSKKQLL